MHKKSTANISNQTETEYFVTYFQMSYPECRGEFNYGDTGIQNLQKTKPCFESYCKKADCRGKGKFCQWNKKQASRTDYADWDYYMECQRKPFQCIAFPCPEARCGLRRSVSIGLLTPDELVAFEKLAVIKNTDGYFLRSREKIEGHSIEEKTRHNSAVKQFKKEVKNVLTPSGFLVAGGYAEFLCRCARVAEEIRKDNAPVNKTKIRPKPANAERDARILELRQKEKSFEEICDTILAEFGDALSENDAGIALTRHCERNNIPFPYGKRGRKAEK
jgi:hypothetical protein